MEDQAADQRRDARGFHQARHRSRRQVRPHPARGAAGGVTLLFRTAGVSPAHEALGPLREEIGTAAWFAALGTLLTEGDLAKARHYAGAVEVVRVTSWPEAEAFLKSPNASLAWWNREEALRKSLLAEAEARHPEHALWTSL